MRYRAAFVMSGLQSVMAAQGIVLLALSLAMLVPAAVDFLASDESFRAFLLASAIACVLGGTVFLASMRSLTGARARVSYRDSFLIMIGAWKLVRAENLRFARQTIP